MREWDHLLDGYLAEYGARGLSEESTRGVRRVLEDWGQWMKRCRPRPRLDQVDASLITRFVRDRTAFKAKPTVYRIMSSMRGMGEYLVREGAWQSNPMRWMKGPKYWSNRNLPRRLDRS